MDHLLCGQAVLGGALPYLQPVQRLSHMSVTISTSQKVKWRVEDTEYLGEDTTDRKYSRPSPSL